MYKSINQYIKFFMYTDIDIDIYINVYICIESEGVVAWTDRDPAAARAA